VKLRGQRHVCAQGTARPRQSRTAKDPALK
jgi:hypothetical protein